MEPAQMLFTEESPYKSGQSFVEAYRQGKIILPGIILLSCSHYNPRDATRYYEEAILMRVEHVQEQKRVNVTDSGGNRIISIVDYCPVKWTLSKSQTVHTKKKKTLASIVKKYKTPLEISGGDDLQKFLKKENLSFDPPLEEKFQLKEHNPQRFFRGNFIKNGILEKQPTFVPVDLPFHIFVAQGFKESNGNEDWQKTLEMFKLACFTTALMYRDIKPPDIFILLENPPASRPEHPRIIPQNSTEVVTRNASEHFNEVDADMIDGSSLDYDRDTLVGAPEAISASASKSSPRQQQQVQGQQQLQQQQQQQIQQSRQKEQPESKAQLTTNNNIREETKKQQTVVPAERQSLQQQQKQQLQEQKQQQQRQQQLQEQKQQQLLQAHQQQEQELLRQQQLKQQQQQQQEQQQLLQQQQLQQQRQREQEQQNKQQLLQHQQDRRYNAENIENISQTSGVRQKAASPLQNHYNGNISSDLLPDDEQISSVSYQAAVNGSSSRHRNDDHHLMNSSMDEIVASRTAQHQYIESDDTDGGPGMSRRSSDYRGRRPPESYKPMIHEEGDLEYQIESRGDRIPRNHGNSSRNSKRDMRDQIDLESDLERMRVNVPEVVLNDERHSSSRRYPEDEMERWSERRSVRSAGGGSIVEARPQQKYVDRSNGELIQDRGNSCYMYEDERIESDVTIESNSLRRPTPSRSRTSGRDGGYYYDDRRLLIPHPAPVQKRNVASRSSYIAPVRYMNEFNRPASRRTTTSGYSSLPRHTYYTQQATPNYDEELHIQQVRQQNMQQLKLWQQQQLQQQRHRQHQPQLYNMEPDLNNNTDYSIVRPKSVSRILLSSGDEDDIILVDGSRANGLSYPSNGRHGQFQAYAIQNDRPTPFSSVNYRHSTYAWAEPQPSRYQVIGVDNPLTPNHNVRNYGSLSRAGVRREYISTYDDYEPPRGHNVRARRVASMIEPQRVGSRIYVHH